MSLCQPFPVTVRTTTSAFTSLRITRGNHRSCQFSAAHHHSSASRLHHLHGLTVPHISTPLPPAPTIPKQHKRRRPKDDRDEAEYRQRPSTSDTSEISNDDEHQRSREEDATTSRCCQRRESRSRWISVEEVGDDREDDHSVAPDVDRRADYGDLESCLWSGGPAWSGSQLRCSLPLW
jgi:hypothetical protein